MPESNTLLSRAAAHPLVRGGLTVVAGIVAGNLTGFFRVALTAYFLGTRSLADSLAVAIGPLDAINSILINSMIFAFVPMLAERPVTERAALFRTLSRLFFRLFFAGAAVILVFAPLILRVLAPGLDPAYFKTAEWNLRIGALSILAAGTSAVHTAMLYSHRRFAAAAFYQPSLNVFSIACALSLWRWLGVHSFAVGYAVGAWFQFLIVWRATRVYRGETVPAPAASAYGELLSRPAAILVYSGLIALNVIFSRAWATASGPGMAAALDYTMRCIGVPLALLVMPISSSLAPEIARLRGAGQVRDAFRLIDKSLVVTGLAAVAACGLGVMFREPVIALLFERGSFTAESTHLVSLVFLGFAPSLIGWSLLELIARSLFALDRPWLPVRLAAIPVLLNVAISIGLHAHAPEMLGVGASCGFLAGFAILAVLARTQRTLTFRSPSPQ